MKDLKGVYHRGGYFRVSRRGAKQEPILAHIIPSSYFKETGNWVFSLDCEKSRKSTSRLLVFENR